MLSTVLSMSLIILFSFILIILVEMKLLKKTKRILSIIAVLPTMVCLYFIAFFLLSINGKTAGKIEQFITYDLYQIDSVCYNDKEGNYYTLSNGKVVGVVSEKNITDIIGIWNNMSWNGDPSTCVTFAHGYLKSTFVPDSIFDYKVEHTDHLYKREDSHFIQGLPSPTDSIQRAYEYFVSSKSTNLIPKIFIWHAGKEGGFGPDIVKEQRAYIHGGLENEVFFCVGLNENLEVVWSDSFSKHRKRSKFEDAVIKSSLKPGTKIDIAYVFDNIVKNYDLWKKPKEQGAKGEDMTSILIYFSALIFPILFVYLYLVREYRKLKQKRDAVG